MEKSACHASNKVLGFAKHQCGVKSHVYIMAANTKSWQDPFTSNGCRASPNKDFKWFDTINLCTWREGGSRKWLKRLGCHGIFRKFHTRTVEWPHQETYMLINSINSSVNAPLKARRGLDVFGACGVRALLPCQAHSQDNPSGWYASVTLFFRAMD